MAKESAPRNPEISIIIVVVSDCRHLTRCLESLLEQVNPPNMEIIVPYEENTLDVSAVQSCFPMVHFHKITGLKPSNNSNKPSHEHLDRMRSIGLSLARGRIVALLEDHDRLDKYWSMEIINTHETPYAGIGGAIENEVDRSLNWAVYFCDFWRYQNPLKEGPSYFISDVNISYKKSSLERIKEFWEDIYHEPFVNRALRSKGEILWLSPKIIAYQHRENLRLGSALRERIDWGRYYAGNRAREFPLLKRIFYTVFSPFLPLLLITRISYSILIKNRLNINFIKAFPILVFLTIFWSLGEFLGYVTARANRVPKIVLL